MVDPDLATARPMRLTPCRKFRGEHGFCSPWNKRRHLALACWVGTGTAIMRFPRLDPFQIAFTTLGAAFFVALRLVF